MEEKAATIRMGHIGTTIRRTGFTAGWALSIEHGTL